MAYEVSLLGSGLTQTPDTNREFASAQSFKLSANRFVIVGRYDVNVTNINRIGVYEINKTTGAITELDSLLPGATYTHTATNAVGVRVSDTRFTYFYSGVGDDGYYITYDVNATTGALSVATAGEWRNADTGVGYVKAIDGTNKFLAWWGTEVQVIEINTSTGAVSSLGSAVSNGGFRDPVHDAIQYASNKFMVAGNTGSNPFPTKVGTYTVDLSTWAITTSALVTMSSAPVGVSNGNASTIAMVDDTVSPAIVVTPYVLYYAQYSSYRGNYIKQFTLNTSTDAIADLGTQDKISTDYNISSNPGAYRTQALDTDNFLVFYIDSDTDIHVGVYSINKSTGATTYETGVEVSALSGIYLNFTDMGDGVYVARWGNGSSQQLLQAIEVSAASTFTASPLIHHMAQAGGLM